MNLNDCQLFHNLKALLVTSGALCLLQACGNGQSQEAPPIRIDGSSTVYPITKLAKQEFEGKNLSTVDIDLEVSVDFSGTLGGFEKFCRGETDINNASVPIPKEAMAECKKNGVAYIELPIAFDAITVVIHRENDWAKSMTVEELKTMWQPSAENTINNWNQVNASWKNRTLNLFAPGKDSGTFQYFTLAIVGQEGASRSDYVFSEDDEAIVNGVIQDPNALGYFGYSYYEQNKDQLKVVGIDNGEGAIVPSRETIKEGKYRPLTRPLFIYVNARKAQENPALVKFVEFYLENAAGFIDQVGYVALPDFAYKLGNIHFEENQIGTVFGGKPILNATLKELLTKTYAEPGKEGYVY